MRRHLASTVSLVAPAVFCTPALADPPPRVSEIVRSEDGDDVVLVTNRGLIFTDRDGTAFRLMCNQALSVGVGQPPSVSYLGSGRWLAATTPGLRVTSDNGCSWQPVEPLATTQTTTLAHDPTRVEVTYVAAYGPGESSIYVTRDGGRGWERLVDLADNDFTHSLVVAPSDPDRVYAAGITFDDGGNFQHYVLRSADSGVSWTRFPLALGLTEERGRVVAVNPLDPDEILIASRARDRDSYPERLFVSRDGGETSQSVFEGPELADAGYGADGQAAWVASVDGLWTSSDGVRSFARTGTADYMTCVQEHEGRLWGCGHFGDVTLGRDGIGISLDGGGSFLPWMTFGEVDETVACGPEGSVASACQQSWDHWQIEVLGYVAPGVPPVQPPVHFDAMPPGSSVDSGVGPSPSAMPPNAGAGGRMVSAPRAPTDGGGCAMQGPGEPQARGAGLAFAMLALTFRRWLGGIQDAGDRHESTVIAPRRS